MGVYVGLVDTDVARQVLDSLQSGAEEVLADDMTRQVRAQLGTLIHDRCPTSRRP